MVIELLKLVIVLLESVIEILTEKFIEGAKTACHLVSKWITVFGKWIPYYGDSITKFRISFTKNSNWKKQEIVAFSKFATRN